MASGWAKEGAVLEQIDASVKEAVDRARQGLAAGPGLSRCADCDSPIPITRRRVVPGVRLCVECQQRQDEAHERVYNSNRRASKDSQMR